MRRNVAVILAGGSGQRFGAPQPKQLLRVAGDTVITHTVRAFERCEKVDEIAIVAGEDTWPEALRMKNSGLWSKLRRVIRGGADRSHSSLAAILDYGDEDCNLLLHDAARPLVSRGLLHRVCLALEYCEAVVTAVPSTDTIVMERGGCVAEVPDRAHLFRVQTPQAFRLSVLREAYRLAMADPSFRATDDSGVVARYQPRVKIHLVEGEQRNIKLTWPEDLPLVERMLKEDERQTTIE